MPSELTDTTKQLLREGYTLAETEAILDQLETGRQADRQQRFWSCVTALAFACLVGLVFALAAWR